MRGVSSDRTKSPSRERSVRSMSFELEDKRQRRCKSPMPSIAMATTCVKLCSGIPKALVKNAIVTHNGSGGVLDMDNYSINEKPFFPTYLAKDTSIIGIVLMRTRTQGISSKASPQVRASPIFRSENILSTPNDDISMTVVMSVVDKNELILDEGMDCCFGRTLDWFDRDRNHNILFHSSFFAYLTFDLSVLEQKNYTAGNGATIYFGDYVKAWANLFIRAQPHQLNHVPFSYPTNQHWVYAFISKGERKVFLTDSMGASENILFVFDRLLAFVEACMKFGNLVDPRSK